MCLQIKKIMKLFNFVRYIQTSVFNKIINQLQQRQSFFAWWTISNRKGLLYDEIYVWKFCFWELFKLMLKEPLELDVFWIPNVELNETKLWTVK